MILCQFLWIRIDICMRVKEKVRDTIRSEASKKKKPFRTNDPLFPNTNQVTKFSKMRAPSQQFYQLSANSYQ